MDDIVVPVVGAVCLFVGMPWVILHYITKWKQAPKITPQDENLLDEMYNLARRLEDRVTTVERIVAADHPDFQRGLGGPAPEWQPGRGLGRPGFSNDRRN